MSLSSLPPIATSGRVSDLVALITNAAKTIENHYLESSSPYVPSLDNLSPHPLDSEIWPSQMRNAVQVLEGACAQLSATLARPNHTIANRSMQTYEISCLDVVSTFKVPDILFEKPLGMDIVELGQKAGTNHEKLGRIMRLLASRHIFKEVSLDVFANNRLSLQLLSSNPLASMISHAADTGFKASTKLSEVLSDPAWGDSQAIDRSPWNKLTGYQGTMYQYFEERAEEGARFAYGIRGANEVIQANSILKDFPWNNLPSGTTICDIGGGIGNMTIELAKAYPHLKLKLQDLPERIHQAETQVWPKDCPEAILENRIEFKPIDFFADAPIESCDIYYLKSILHNWPDKECIQILCNIRTVLKPGGRILLHDYVLQHANRLKDTSDHTFTDAPEPLLPNYGIGRARPYNMDLGMMVLLNSRERTLEEVINIGTSAGLKFVKLWETGEMSVVELKL